MKEVSDRLINGYVSPKSEELETGFERHFVVQGWKRGRRHDEVRRRMVQIRIVDSHSLIGEITDFF